jgi:hypothetical protein
MKVLLLINDVTYMSMTSPPFLVASSMRSMKDYFFLYFRELKSSLNRCRIKSLCLRKTLGSWLYLA